MSYLISSVDLSTLSPNILGDRNSIIPNHVPGRLNDFPIYAWWDFTDIRALGGGSSDAIATNNLQQCDDKGPNNVGLSVDSSGKGPQFVASGGQDDYPHILLNTPVDNDNSDYMNFIIPQDINSRKFTATIIFDMNTDNITKTNTFFKLVGGDGSFTSFLEFKWDAIFDRLFVGISHSGQTDRFAYSTVDSQHLDGTVGGDANSNFNWVSMVLEADGTIKVYMRGVPITLFQSGTFADTTIVSADLVSTLFDNDQIFDSSDITSATQLDSKVYEVMMFNESLSHQQLHGIDMYIKNKYKNYQFGRVNGY